MKSLNVGCGSDLWGDVRVDVTFSFITAHFKPTVLADAHYLPFKDGSFEVVKASHLLEHLKNPFKALDEMLRVATKELILKIPTEWDVLPVFLSFLLPIPHFSSLKWAYQTRKKKLRLWILNPKILIKYFKQNGWESSCVKGGLCLFAILESGRKAKYFRWLTERVRIPYEYIVTAKKIRSMDKDGSSG